MFGMGFMEILLIAVIAIIALGPDKLPDAMVQIAKFIRKFKSGLDDAKTTLDNELNVSEMKSQANKFKAQIEDMKTSVSQETKVDLGIDDIMKDDLNDNSPKEEKIIEVKTEPKSDEKVSFKKKEKSKKSNDTADKFKVNFDEDKKEENA